MTFFLFYRAGGAAGGTGEAWIICPTGLPLQIRHWRVDRRSGLLLRRVGLCKSKHFRLFQEYDMMQHFPEGFRASREKCWESWISQNQKVQLILSIILNFSRVSLHTWRHKHHLCVTEAQLLTRTTRGQLKLLCISHTAHQEQHCVKINLSIRKMYLLFTTVKLYLLRSYGNIK